MSWKRFAAKAAISAIAAVTAFVGVVWADVTVGTGRYSAATGDFLNALGLKQQMRVSTNAELAAYRWGGRVTRDGFAAPGDGGKGDYTYSSTACSNPDNGAQVPAGTGCYLLDPSATLTPQMFGVTCNDTESTAPWQAMIDAATRLGRSVRPVGNNCIVKLTSMITVAGRLDFVGPGAQLGNGFNTGAQDPQSPGPGFWLHLAHTGIGHKFQPAAGTTLPGAYNNGSRVWGVGTYRDQPTPSTVAGTAYAPCNCDYDWNFTLTEADLDLVTLNASRFITSHVADRLYIRRAVGQPLITGIYLESAYDTQVIDDVHFWLFWSGNYNVLKYLNDNAAAVRTGRADNLVIKKLFAFGYGTCLDVTQFPGSADGAPPGALAGAQIGAMDCDHGQTSINIHPETNYVQMAIASLGAAGPGNDFASATNDLVIVSGSNATVTVADATFDTAARRFLVNNGTNNKVFITNARLERFNQNFSGTPVSDAAIYTPGANSLTAIGPWRSINLYPTVAFFGGNTYSSAISAVPLDKQPTVDAAPVPYVLVNGATLALPVGSGRFIMKENTAGQFCDFSYNGSVVTLQLGSTANCATTPAAGKISLSWTGSGANFVVTNNLGSTTTLLAANIRVARF